jgi:hypothetical protein
MKSILLLLLAVFLTTRGLGEDFDASISVIVDGLPRVLRVSHNHHDIEANAKSFCEGSLPCARTHEVFETLTRS